MEQRSDCMLILTSRKQCQFHQLLLKNKYEMVEQLYQNVIDLFNKVPFSNIDITR